jgi:hypothetical protein
MARRGRRTQWVSAAFLAAGSTALAAAPPAAKPALANAPVQASPTTAADADLLLYLSEFEDAQGEWVDPADLPASADTVPEEDDDAR